MQACQWAIENVGNANGASAYSDAIARAYADDFAPDGQALAGLLRTVYHRPALLEHRLQRHSHSEALGSATLRKIGEKFCEDPGLRARLLEHAQDEARHSRMFRSLAAKTRAASGEPHDFDYITEFNDGQIDEFDGDLAHFICDTHVAEIRSLAMVRSYLAAAEEDDTAFGQSARACFNAIHADELRHITWTGDFVVSSLGEGRLATSALEYALAAYDRLTWLDVAATAELLAG